jgi:regulator of protease activity HflC (stomatin/prohibitin superfamily)
LIFPRLYFVKEDEQLLIESFGTRRVINGPTRYVARPLERVKHRKGIVLAPTDYIRLRNNLTGELRNELGPQLYFLGPHEIVDAERKAIPLSENEYVRLQDTKSGEVRIERGEGLVYLSPTETILEPKQNGIDIDDDTAVVVRDISTGQLSLITEKQVFVPTAHQRIVNIRPLIKLEDHEVVVVRDRAGRYRFRRGSDEDRSFFLDTHEDLVLLNWSAGLHKDKRSLSLSKFDMRPKFMWYEFEVRTQDNVELIIGITFFWQITDMETMIRATDDTTGDICSHARSMIIQGVSQVSLERFLAEFNTIVGNTVLREDDPFYQNRGCIIHAVEIRSITCKDPDTQRILQEIIQETTNRLNRLQKQESENEIHIKQIQGQIDAEEMRGQLLETQRDHSMTEALTIGQAEAERIRSFLETLGDNLSIDEKLAVFNTLRKHDMLEVISSGSAQVYFTPSDVDLSIEARQQSNGNRR